MTSALIASSPRMKCGFAGLLLCLCISFGAVTSVEAWGCAGHMLTTQIALQLVPKPVARYFESISAYQQMLYTELTSLNEVSCWPDDIKSFTKAGSDWHYYDLCLLRNANGSDIVCPAEPEGKMPTALSMARTKLASVNETLSPQEQGFWLAYLVHLVGDFHQPLHTTTLFDPRFPNGDLAGNRFTIFINGVKWNLHSFHDTCAGLLNYDFPQRPLAEYPDDITTLETLAASLIQSQTFDYPSQPEVLNTTVWLDEGFSIGSNISYTLPDGQPLPFGANFTSDSTYVLRLQRVLQNRIALGGRRLGNIMTAIYNARFSS